MADRGSRDRQPALCPFPGVDDGRPWVVEQVPHYPQVPRHLSILSRSLPCPLQAPGGRQAPLSLASTGARRLG